MNIRSVFTFGLLSLLAVGCAANRELARADELRRDSSWPMIRAAAEVEVARREGSTEWSHSAYYAPRENTNGVWIVIASGAYPLNRMGDSIELLIRNGGEVVSYSPRLASHPK